MGKNQESYGKPVRITIELPEELSSGMQMMAKVKNLSQDSLLRLWIEEALEREELRFERLLLFAGISEELSEAEVTLLQRLKDRYFDESTDGERGLDSYLVKSRNLHHLYQVKPGNRVYAVK